jgi:hypothetical protein
VRLIIAFQQTGEAISLFHWLRADRTLAKHVEINEGPSNSNSSMSALDVIDLILTHV